MMAVDISLTNFLKHQLNQHKVSDFERDSLTYVAWEERNNNASACTISASCSKLKTVHEVKNGLVCYSFPNEVELCLQESALHNTVLYKGEVERFGARNFPSFGVLYMLLCRT
jgi:hypothetical protein